jgi:hypothetical protein
MAEVGDVVAVWIARSGDKRSCAAGGIWAGVRML